MPDEPAFDRLRTAAQRGLLVKAFKIFPARLDQILGAEGWTTFTDFMAAVDRMGRVLLQFQRPRVKTIEEGGVQAAIDEARRKANTEAFLKLLAGAFVNKPGEEPDTDAVLEAFEPYGILSWYDFAMAVQEIAIALYADRTGGQSPLDMAKPPTQMFYHMKPDSPEEYASMVTAAFGLDTVRHLEAVLAAFYAGELTLEDLDRSVNNPGLLTEIVNRTPSNPHKGIVFGTPPAAFSGTSPASPVLGQDLPWREDYLPWRVKLRLPTGRSGPHGPIWETVYVDTFATGEPQARSAAQERHPRGVITGAWIEREGFNPSRMEGAAVGARAGKGRPVRPVVTRLIEAVALDVFPDSPAVLVDFEISDQAHYEALYYPIRAGEITAEDLDRVLGDAEAITRLVNAAPSNPHKGIVFGSMETGLGRDFPRKEGLLLLKDLDRPGCPGEFVAVTAADWTSGSAVIEGWRGPEMPSEDFGRTRLQEVSCGNVLLDMVGYWECIPPGIKVI